LVAIVYRKAHLISPIPILDKNDRKIGIEDNFLNLIKCINEKPTTNIILNGKDCLLPPYDKEQGKAVCSHYFFSTMYLLEVLTSAKVKEKK